MVLCTTTSVGRRKLFWATQAGACGTLEQCGASCGVPGLALEKPDSEQATIAVDNWIVGLVINMLMTDGRMPNTACGYSPAGQGGHWSESYITADDGDPGVGTLLRTVPPQGRVQAIEATLAAYAKQTLNKLVTRGVARAVDVNVAYVASGTFNLEATVVGVDARTSKVGLSAQRLANGWIWG